MLFCIVLLNEGPKPKKVQLSKIWELSERQNGMGNTHIALYKTSSALHEGKQPMSCSLLYSLEHCPPEQGGTLAHMLSQKANEWIYINSS